MAKLPLALLTTILTFTFLIVGISKLTANVNEDLHKDLKQSFSSYVKVIPFAKRLGWKPTAYAYRTFVGIAEIACALLLMFFPDRIQKFANVVLLAITAGAVYNHVASRHSLDSMLPALGVGILLIIRYVLHSRSLRRSVVKRRPLPSDDSAEIATESSGETGSTPKDEKIE